MAGHQIGSLSYRDLIGTPWEEMPCVEVVAVVLERLGRIVPEGALPRGGILPANLSEADLNLDCWERIGDTADCATELGDVILADNGRISHVWVLVGPGRLLTSSRKANVHAVRLSATTRVVGVYRLREDPA